MSITTVSLLSALENYAGDFQITTPGASTATTSEISLNQIHTNATTGINTTQTNLVNLFKANFNCGGPGSVGSFQTIYSVLNLNQATGNTNGSYCSMQAASQATVNDGGTAITAAGNMFGFNVNTRLVTNATFWNSLIGQEIDVAVATGCSVGHKIGLQVVQTTLDGVVGSDAVDTAITISNQGGVLTQWDVGYGFGHFTGVNAIKSTGTLIGTIAHGGPVGGSMGTVAYGMDIAGYTFTGAPIVAALQTPAASSSTGKTGSVCWSSGFVYVCVRADTWARATLSTW